MDTNNSYTTTTTTSSSSSRRKGTNVEELEKASEGWVPIMFDDGRPRKHRVKQDKVKTKETSMELVEETIDVKGGEGEEKPGGDRKANMRQHSFNERISDYISRAKLKFRTMAATSFVENGNTASFPEDSGGKQKALK